MKGMALMPNGMKRSMKWNSRYIYKCNKGNDIYRRKDMKKRKQLNADELRVAKTGGINEACMRYGLGKALMRQTAENAEAVIHIGKRYLINFTIVDDYMDSLSIKR